MPTTKKHLEDTIIWCENQILNSEQSIRNEFKRIEDLEKFMRDCNVRLILKEMK